MLERSSVPSLINPLISLNKVHMTTYKQVWWVRQNKWEYFSEDYKGIIALPKCPPDVPMKDIRLIEIRCSDEDYTQRTHGLVHL